MPAIVFSADGHFASSSESAGLLVDPAVCGVLPDYSYRICVNINILLGDDEARDVGLNCSRLKILLLIAAFSAGFRLGELAGVVGWVYAGSRHLRRSVSA